MSELLHQIYGFNWASTADRENGLSSLLHLAHDDFESHLSDEVGGRVVRGIEQLRDFGDALEQDFEELIYEAGEIHEAPDGRTVVTGRIYGRGRSSSLPLAGEFGHVWAFRDGRILRVDAYLDPAKALAAAGLAGE